MDVHSRIPTACVCGLMLLSSLALAHAQPLQDGGEDEIAEFTFQTFYFGSLVSGRVPELYYLRTDDYRPLNLAPHSLGLRHRFKGSLPFQVYEEQLNEEGEIVYRPVGRLEEGFDSLRPGHQVLLVDRQNKTYRLSAIPAGQGAVKPGEVLVFNGSRYPLAFRVSDQDGTRLAPSTFTVTDYRDGEQPRFRLEIAAERADEWRLIHNALVTQVAKRPLFLMVYPNQRVPDRWNVRFLRLNR